jgi:3-methyladenine DNA glycosylase/8-oxoguanine DNA glycosylase
MVSAKRSSAATNGAEAAAAAIASEILSADPHEHLRKVDERLAQVIERAGRSPLADRGKEKFDGEQAFRALVHVIVSQQLSGKAADTIFGRLEALGGGQLPGPAQLLAIPDDALRAAGLSGAKTRGVKDLAARVLDGSLRLDTLHTSDDEAVIGALTQVRGIGRWSAEMFLMFRLGRLDILSTADLGLRKGLMQLHGLDDLPDPATMERLTSHWRPFRSIGCWYLWRVAEQHPPHRRKQAAEAKKGAAKRGAKKGAAKKGVAKRGVAKKAAAKRAAPKGAAKRAAPKKTAARRAAPKKAAATKPGSVAPSASRAERVLSKR